MAENCEQLALGVAPQVPKATAGSSVGSAEGLRMAAHRLSMQRPGKICCDAEAEGVAVLLVVAVALREGGALGEGRSEAVLIALGGAEGLGAAEGAAVGEGLLAGDSDAGAEGEGEKEAGADAVGEGRLDAEAAAEALAVALGVGGGTQSPAVLSR